MAWFGAVAVGTEKPLWFLLVYWGIFVLALFVALYMALLDIRYIRLLYLLEEREIFENTIGNPDFRKSLREAQSRNNGAPQDGDPNT